MPPEVSLPNFDCHISVAAVVSAVGVAVGGAVLGWDKTADSLAFLAGLLPLVFATGPGAATRQNVSIAVFGGMIAACTIGLVIIPLVYAMFQKARELFHHWRGEDLYAHVSVKKEPAPEAQE